MKKSLTKKSQVCNLARIPTSIESNPIYQTSLQIIDNPDMDLTDTILYDHYQNYSPETLYDIYNVVDKLKNYSFSDPFLPWLHAYPVTTVVDNAFIYRDNEYIRNQFKKIKHLVKSIQKHGYCPENFPDRETPLWQAREHTRQGVHITGYWLKHENSKKLYVVSGNHRAPVCFAVNPDLEIPFIYQEPHHFKPRDFYNRRPDLPETYDTKDISSWPSVVSGFLNEDEAFKITKVYFGDKDE